MQTTTTKPKYKRGTLVEYTCDQNHAKHNVITGVLEKDQGFFYELQNEEGSYIPEASITKAYAPVKDFTPRKRGPRKSKMATGTNATPTATSLSA